MSLENRSAGPMKKSIWEQFETAPEWEPAFRFFFTRVTLMDGTDTRSPYLMKRQAPDGTWQYRRMTDEEFRKAVGFSG